MGLLEKTGVLVIRAWIEPGVGEHALRARITRTLDVAEQEAAESAAASEEEILAVVQEWLSSFTGSPPVTAG